MLHLCFSIYNTVQKTISEEEIALIVYVVFFVLTIVITFALFFLTFQKRKNQLLLKNIEQQKQFDEELIKTQQEIQEETLKNIGRELHDNVGQMLVLANMQINALSKAATDELKPKVNNASDVLRQSLEEVRALSKSLNSDVIFNLGFDTTVKNEVERLNKMGVILASLEVNGNKVNFENQKDETILFRIVQEFFSNTLKYAEAENLSVVLDYQPQCLNIKVADDGIGFDITSAEKGSGLINMEKRAELINAQFKLESQPEKGTTLDILYPYREV